MALSYQSLVRKPNTNTNTALPAPATQPKPMPSTALPHINITTTAPTTQSPTSSVAANPTTTTVDIFSADYVPPAPSAVAPEDDEGNLFDRIAWWCVKTLLALLLSVAGMLLVWQVAGRTYLSIYNTSDHGNTLNQFIDNTRYLDYEVYAEFDAFGFKLFENSQYNHLKVAYSDEASAFASRITFGQNICVHNHPLQDCPFSTGDLAGFVVRKCNKPHDPVRDIVISPNYVYELAASDDWLPDLAPIETFLNQITGNLDLAYANGFITPYLPDSTTPDSGAEVYVATDLLLERFAEEFGLTYTVTPIEEWSLT